jgi:hypothetical protein
MVLSSLQSRLQSMQTNLHSSPSYRGGRAHEEHQHQHASSFAALNHNSTPKVQKKTKTKAKKENPPPLEAPVIWSNSFFDDLSREGAAVSKGGLGLVDLQSDDDDEGIWPNEWPSGLVSP